MLDGRLQVFARPGSFSNFYGHDILRFFLYKHYIFLDQPPQNVYLLGLVNKRFALLVIGHAQKPQDVFWIDDVWLTGYVAGSLNIPRLSLNSYFTVYR
jgi:hypothetical protein